VGLHSSRAEVQLHGDLAGRLPRGEERKDVLFSRRQGRAGTHRSSPIERFMHTDPLNGPTEEIAVERVAVDATLGVGVEDDTGGKLWCIRMTS
jgi:hypothetical protein